MLVSRSSFEEVLARLAACDKLSLDTETTGLRPYHGDRLFSLIIGQGPDAAYYFNFWPSYPQFSPENVLGQDHLRQMQASLFSDTRKLWYIHKFNFDMHILGADGLELAGTVHCTRNIGRVVNNEVQDMDLASALSRVGLAKDDKVLQWIEENKAFEHQKLPGKNKRTKNRFFYKVPPDIIVPYGLDDAKGCFSLGLHQEEEIEKQAGLYPPGVPNLRRTLQTERRLAKTIFRMERVGVKIDRPYCMRAAQYEGGLIESAAQKFKKETGRDYLASNKLFQDVFLSEKERWEYTDKGNPSFESDTLKLFQNPVAKVILELRDAKSKLDFYNGFLYHADANDRIHANFNPGRTRTGRLSSSEPNLQNLTDEEGETEQEFVVRRAIVPTPGYIFILPDYDQMEYKMELDYAKHMMIEHFKRKGLTWVEGYFEIANRVRDGFDIHQATSDMLVQMGFTWFTRKMAKTLNFALLYGMGVEKLAWTLGVSLDRAQEIKSAYFRAMPYVQFMIQQVQSAIKAKGWIRNWAGRRYTFENRNDSYKGPNTLIQGGCADATKEAMNRIDERFLSMKSRLVLTMHDELPCEIHESEVAKAPRLVKEIMESVYPHRYIPLTAGMEWSEKSLADKVKGFPA